MGGSFETVIAGRLLTCFVRVRVGRLRAVGIADVMVMRDLLVYGGEGLRRGALSARQAHGRPGVLGDGQRISAATCMQVSREPGGFSGASTPATP
uniref:Uncharacterized protein n=1 Tax=Streptomyces avermitilis TaxID=33903 RepID=A0A499VTT3_STRAX|nr:hypothetical protein SAVMC3_90390 [Streptomyces avermitilis]